MSKKVLNTQPVINELRGQSVFFKQAAPSQSGSDEKKPNAENKTHTKSNIQPPINVEKSSRKPIPNQASSPIYLPAKKKNDTVDRSESNHASIDASTLAYVQDDIVETVRKTVKQVGRDTLYVRLTADEKHQVASVVYALNEVYRGESRKTSENEIGRIGVNFLLEDHKVNGKQSVLARVLAALHA